MEHLRHFRLPRDPFRNDPQRRFYFESEQHRDAERRLTRGIRQGKGLAVLTGSVGSGKTTLVRHLLDQLDEGRFEAGLLVLIQGAVDTDWLLQRMAQQIGIDQPAPARGQVLGQIYRRLVRLRQRGRHAVILIDEAQMLDRREILVELRGLLNLEFDEQRLLSLVLAGLPELETVLQLDAPLADRVEIRVELSCFDPRNAHAYLSHRICRAGGEPAILEAEAVAAIARLATGIPRRMNTLADNALFEAYLAGRRAVTAADVERAARDLGWAGAAAAFLAPEPGEEASVVIGEPEPAVAVVVPDDRTEPEIAVPIAEPEPDEWTETDPPLAPAAEPDAYPCEDTSAEPEQDDTTQPEITLTDPVPSEGEADGEEGWEGLVSDAPPKPDLPGEVAATLEIAAEVDVDAAPQDVPPRDAEDESEIDALFVQLVDKS